MRWGVGALLVWVAVGCAGCVTQSTPQPIASAVAPGQARLSITRVDGTSLLGSSVHIAVNDVPVADLAEGQTYTAGVRPGAVTVTASGTADIGQYTVHVKAVPGKTYAFQISKRMEHVVAGAVGGLAGLILETAVSGEHGGAFQITPVKP
jgi:hypothetical protein